MKNLFVLFIIVCILSGCFATNKPVTGDVTYTHLSQSEEPVSKKKPEPKEGIGAMSAPVIVLLGLGAASMMMGLGATLYDDNQDDTAKVFALAFGGTGLVLWGVAGITALAED